MKNQIQEILLITHIAQVEPPLLGMKRIQYYSVSVDSIQKGIYFFGRNTKLAFNESKLKALEENGSMKKLSEMIPIKDKKTLWIDTENRIYIGNQTENNKELELIPNI